MYKLTINFRDGKKLEQSMKEADVRELFKRIKSGKEKIRPVKWATLVTPSGVSRDVTNLVS